MAYVALLHKPSAHLKSVVGANIFIMPSLILVSLSALFLVFSFPTLEFSWLVWIGFIPLFFALENKSGKQAFLISYLWGVIFWAGLIYWLVNVTLLGYIFLVLYLALYAGIFGFLVFRVTGYWLLVTIPSAWVSLEFLRSHLFTGFGWGLLGYSQYKNLSLIQIADITGVYGVSFLIILVNLAIFRAIKTIALKKLRVTSYELPVTVLLVAVSLVYGHYRIYQLPVTSYQLPVRVSLIQGNISPYEKWEGEFKNSILEKYFMLSKVASSKEPALIIWPESSFPAFWEEEPDLKEKLLSLARELKTYLLIGVPTSEGGRIYNSSLLISEEGREIGRYRKIHLVPFGEYVPLADILGFLGNMFPIGGYKRGKDLTLFTIDKFPVYIPGCGIPPDKRGIPAAFKFNADNAGAVKFSVLICFEDIFPSLVRRFVREGASFLINITEDGWYGKTGASFQHAQAAVFRAVENRRFVVRVANTGLSCIIDDKGKIISQLRDEKGRRIFITGVHTAEILPGSGRTFYNLCGDLFAFLCVIPIFVILLLQKFPPRGIFSKENPGD